MRAFAPFATPIAVGLLWALRLSDRRAGVVLMYHGVDVHGGDADHELVPAMPARVLEAQLRHLKRHYHVVPAGHMFAAVNRRRRGDRYPVAITFDDDLRTHISIALPVLERTGISATFFLTGASLRGPYSFWWERLARVPKENLREAVSTLQLGIPERFELEELGAAMKQLEPEIRENVEMRLAQVAGPDPPDAGIRAQDVRTLVEARMEIGFHTLLHHNLRLLTTRLLAGAMQHGRAELEEVVGEPLRVICYPYGEADERVAIAAKEAGFLIGFTAESRTVTPADDPLLCGRVSPTHGSVGGLAARIVVTLLRRR